MRPVLLVRLFVLPAFAALVAWAAGPAAGFASGSDAGCLIDRRPASPGTAFVDVTVLPMDRERLLTKRTVLVRGCRVDAIGHRDSVAVPDGFEVVRGGDDLYLLPGLVDAHTHLRYDGDLALYLAGGVTTVRNMIGSPRHLAWREEIGGGAFGPRILTAGPLDYENAVSRAEVEADIDALADAGYDFVKVFDPLPADTYTQVLSAAGRRGLPVAGHIPRAVGGRELIDLGQQQTIEHAEQFVYHWFYDDLDRTRIPELARAVADAGIAVTPTLEVIHSWIAVVDSPASLRERPETRWLHPETTAYWHTFARGSSFENRLIADFQEAIVLELARAGVPLLAGTDAYQVGIMGPAGLHRELARLEAAGLSRYAVLRTATAAPAEVLGYGAGRVEEGRIADLLLVRGNPLENLGHLAEVEGVMLDGIWHPRTELASRLDSLEDAYGPGNAFVRDALGRRAPRAIEAHRALRAGGDERRTSPDVLSYVASILRGRGESNDALAVYELALEESPGSASILEGIARTLLARGEIEGAVARLEEALRSDPERASARVLLAEIEGRR